MTTALGRVEHGVWDFYSAQDVVLLGMGTTLFGTIDRKHDVSAGTFGFRVDDSFSKEARQAYTDKLFQVAYRPAMLASGNAGDRFGWASRQFCQTWLAPIIRQHHDPDAAAGSDDGS